MTGDEEEVGGGGQQEGPWFPPHLVDHQPLAPQADALCSDGVVVVRGIHQGGVSHLGLRCDTHITCSRETQKRCSVPCIVRQRPTNACPACTVSIIQTFYVDGVFCVEISWSISPQAAPPLPWQR